MTISTEVSQNRYSGNGSTVVFAYAFKINSSADLTVIIADADDVQTTLVLNTNYTLSGVGESSGGNVTTSGLSTLTGSTGDALPSGWSITITRTVALTQLTDIANQGAFFADTHEAVFDYLTMIDQKQQEQLDRCPKISQTLGTAAADLPDDIDGMLTTMNGYYTGSAANAAAAAQAAAALSLFKADDYTTLSLALTAIGAADATLLVYANLAVDEAVTVPDNVTLLFYKGGKFTIGSGYTLTINGGIQAGAYQIFAGDGSVTGGPLCDKIYPEWFGALGSNVTTDATVNTQAIQKAINLTLRAAGGVRTKSVVQFSDGVYYVNGSITFYAGIRLKGSSAMKSVTDPQWGGTCIAMVKDINLPTLYADTFVHGAQITDMRIAQEAGSTVTVTGNHGIHVAQGTGISGFGELSLIDNVACQRCGGDGIRFGTGTESTPLMIGRVSLHLNGANGINFIGENYGFVYCEAVKGDANAENLIRISTSSEQSDFFFNHVGVETGGAGLGHLDQGILLEDNTGQGVNVNIGQLDIVCNSDRNANAAVIRSTSATPAVANNGPNLVIGKITNRPLASVNYAYLFYDNDIAAGDADANGVPFATIDRPYQDGFRTGYMNFKQNSWAEPRGGLRFWGVDGKRWSLGIGDRTGNNELRFNHTTDKAESHNVGFYDSAGTRPFRITETGAYTKGYRYFEDGCYVQEVAVPMTLSFGKSRIITFTLSQTDFAFDVTACSTFAFRQVAKYSGAGNTASTTNLSFQSSVGDNKVVLGALTGSGSSLTMEVANVSGSVDLEAVLYFKFYNRVGYLVSNDSLGSEITSTITQPNLLAGSIFHGAATPEGAITAPVGCLFLRTDGGSGTTLYIKESGTGNTGWVGK